MTQDFGSEPRDFLKGSQIGWMVYLGVIPFLIPCLTSKTSHKARDKFWGFPERKHHAGMDEPKPMHVFFGGLPQQTSHAKLTQTTFRVLVECSGFGVSLVKETKSVGGVFCLWGRSPKRDEESEKPETWLWWSKPVWDPILVGIGEFVVELGCSLGVRFGF